MNSNQILSELMKVYRRMVNKKPSISRRSCREVFENILEKYSVKLSDIEYDFILNYMEEQGSEIRIFKKKPRLIDDNPTKNQYHDEESVSLTSVKTKIEQELLKRNVTKNRKPNNKKFPYRTRAVARRKLSSSQDSMSDTELSQVVSRRKITALRKLQGSDDTLALVKYDPTKVQANTCFSDDEEDEDYDDESICISDTSSGPWSGSTRSSICSDLGDFLSLGLKRIGNLSESDTDSNDSEDDSESEDDDLDWNPVLGFYQRSELLNDPLSSDEEDKLTGLLDNKCSLRPHDKKPKIN
ncbi:hypothetical protein GWI33_000116 [Rhynchophorus ferrugineus]|uniref:Uncharacterized protein n=1 Tax=Rhynchophorus ferrugineus TaxID=354439 RepID=A0A834IW53_RHYFE|nr:hypothetical protein GWI33_000116 [Rhynchophorus ferrugineus]